MTGRHLVWLERAYPALAVREFRLLWLATVPALFAFQFGVVTSGYAAVRLSDSASIVGLVGGAWGVPLLFVPLIGGVAADRLSRRRIMLVSQAALAVSTTVVAALAYTDVLAVWHLVALGLVQGTSFAFVTPARVAYAADTVGQALIASALGTHYASLTLAGIVGPAVAGALLVVPVIGIGGSYALMAVLYVLCVAGLAHLPDRASAVQSEAGSAARRLIDGLLYVWSSSLLRRLIAIATLAALLGMPYVPLMPLYAERVFGAGSTALGLLLAASGLGSFLGAVVAGIITGRRSLAAVLPVLALGFGLALIGLAVSPTLELALIAATAIGVAGTGLMITNNAVIINASDPRFFGRVWSINQLTFGFGPVGAILLGVVADVAGPRGATALGAVLMIVLTVAIALTATQMLAYRSADARWASPP